MKKKPAPLLSQILKKVAPKIGATIFIEPKWGVVGQIKFKNGTKRYTHFSKLDINQMGSSEIAIDKDYANFFMKKMRYPTITGKSFYSKQWAKAIKSKDDIDSAFKYAKRLGFPVIVKPNSKSQGKGVGLVYNKTEFYRSLQQIFQYDKVALVEEYIQGKDYRVVVLDKRIISAYERIPLSVIGDGTSSILALLHAKKKYFNKINRDIKINEKDIRIKNKLKHQKLSLRFIPKKNERVYLLDNANLSQGGDSVDVTDNIHPLFKKIAIKLTGDMGLRLCGVDLMIKGDIKNKPKKYWVIEVNSAPGLDHYVTTGASQQKIVEDMYLEVLKSMAR